MSLALLTIKVDDRTGFAELRIECEDRGSMAEHICQEMVTTFLEVETAAEN